MQFSIFWDNLKFEGKCIFSSPFVFFSSLFQESTKRGPRSGPRAVKIQENWTQGRPNGAQKLASWATRCPKAPPSTNNMQNDPPKVAKLSPKCYNGVPKPLECKKKTIKVFKSLDEAQTYAANAENTEAQRDHTPKQPTKEMQRDANQQTTKKTNRHPHTHLHKQTP